MTMDTYRAVVGEPPAFLHADAVWSDLAMRDLALLAGNMLPENKPGTLTNIAFQYIQPATSLTLMKDGNSITGRLTDSHGKPVPHAAVLIDAVDAGARMGLTNRKLAAMVPGNAATAVIGIRANTDEEGRFRLQPAERVMTAHPEIHAFYPGSLDQRPSMAFLFLSSSDEEATMPALIKFVPDHTRSGEGSPLAYFCPLHDFDQLFSNDAAWNAGEKTWTNAARHVQIIGFWPSWQKGSAAYSASGNYHI
jgi:hypothetical protein